MAALQIAAVATLLVVALALWFLSFHKATSRIAQAEQRLEAVSANRERGR